MPCETPRRAYPTAEGGRVKFFKPTDRQYYQEPYNGLLLPCGICILCRQEQARQAAVRITHEATLHDQNCFLTLTYNEQSIPQDGGLNYQHLTDFWKRLRYHYGKLSYYAVGEYGDKTNRPHYHACVFGHDFFEGAVVIKEEPHRLWTNARLNQAWGLGHVAIGTLDHNTASYTTGYILKKQRAKQRYCVIETGTGELITVEGPRAFMSRNIGRRWWERWGEGVQNWDRVIINGKPQKPPKAYDRWLGEINKQRMEEIKNKRVNKALKKQETQEGRHARAHNARTREKQRQKSV